MPAFITENLPTIITGAVVLAIVAFAAVKAIRNLRAKKLCSCGCEGCGSAASCDKRND